MAALLRIAEGVPECAKLPHLDLGFSKVFAQIADQGRGSGLERYFQHRLSGSEPWTWSLAV